MGTLRTLFAIAVVFAHSYGEVFVGGRNAVQLFYMISGFLISYVLVEKKAYATVRDFYINRYLRLYPIYGVVALLSLLVFATDLLAGKTVDFFEVYSTAPIAAGALLVFSNIALISQDWVLFSGVEHNTLVFSTYFPASDVVLHQGLLVSQAWTLGVELTFYLIAPFILGRKKIIFLLLLSSIAIRVFLIQIGLGRNDPWTYRFFPTELALFCCGALAHQVLLPFYRKYFSVDRMEVVARNLTYFLVLVTLVYWLIPIRELIKAPVFFFFFFFFMPFTFVFQSRRNWDKWVGDLSYPIYICHLLVTHAVTLILVKVGAADKISIAFLTVIFSIAFSMALNSFVANSVEALRSRFRAGTPIASSQF